MVNSCSSTQVVEISLVEEVESYPNMNSWAPIKRNILTEDDNHINIPYFGDQVERSLISCTKQLKPLPTLMLVRSLMKTLTSSQVSRPMSVRT